MSHKKNYNLLFVFGTSFFTHFFVPTIIRSFDQNQTKKYHKVEFN